MNKEWYSVYFGTVWPANVTDAETIFILNGNIEYNNKHQICAGNRQCDGSPSVLSAVRCDKQVVLVLVWLSIPVATVSDTYQKYSAIIHAHLYMHTENVLVLIRHCNISATKDQCSSDYILNEANVLAHKYRNTKV